MARLSKAAPAAIAIAAIVTGSLLVTPAIASTVRLVQAQPAAEEATKADYDIPPQHCFWKRHRVWTYYGAVWKREKVCYD